MQHLLLDTTAGVTTVTLNRPDVRNAFNEEVITELTAVFLELGKRRKCAAWCWPATARRSAPAPT
jgi:enoyl-CoA hydratase/carnithine racemase